jgi:hypothetical protein
MAIELDHALASFVADLMVNVAPTFHEPAIDFCFSQQSVSPKNLVLIELLFPSSLLTIAVVASRIA